MSAIRSTNVIDEMFPEASGNNMMELDEPLTSSSYNIEMGNIEKVIHTEYYNDFGDIFDDDDFN